MKRVKRIDTFDVVARLWVGDSFLDYEGNVVERVGQSSLFIGRGYDSLNEETYLAAVDEGTFFNGYPMHPDDYADLKDQLSFMTL